MFETALPVILKFEGGYVNDPDDSGGATNKGITQATYNGYRISKGLKWEPVKSITDEVVSDIYYQNYWLDGKCDKLPPRLAMVHFDFGINAGIGRAAKTLQRTLGARADGIIGPMTLALLSTFDEATLIKEYSKLRVTFYNNICKRKPSQVKFLKGWLLRTSKIEALALK